MCPCWTVESSVVLSSFVANAAHQNGSSPGSECLFSGYSSGKKGCLRSWFIPDSRAGQHCPAAFAAAWVGPVLEVLCFWTPHRSWWSWSSVEEEEQKFEGQLKFVNTVFTFVLSLVLWVCKWACRLLGDRIFNVGKEEDGQRLKVNGRKGLRQQGSQARVYNG